MASGAQDVGTFPELEDQMTTNTPSESWSPDVLDACVWAISQLGMTQNRRVRVHSAATGTIG